jgi:hypothetical protein
LGKAKVDEGAVKQILLRHQRGETQVALANEFGINTKTVSRILSGQSWKHVRLTDADLTDGQTLTAHNEVIALKTKYGFDVERPLFWGAYDSYDGVRHVATDGVIAWISKALHDTACQYASKGFDEFPYFSNKAFELNSFEVADMMDAALGRILKPDIEDFGNLVALRPRDGEPIFVDQKFWGLAQKLRLHFYEVKNDPRRLFLIKLDAQYETEAGLQACVAITTP